MFFVYYFRVYDYILAALRKRNPLTFIEGVFTLVYYGRFSYSDVMMMTKRERISYLETLAKTKEEELKKMRENSQVKELGSLT